MRAVVCAKDCACAGGPTASHEDLQQCCAYQKAVSALRTYFKFPCFRAGHPLHGKDTFVRIPTGGGKSLCMFLSVLSHAADEFGVIISPLIGLMDEQVYMLQYIIHVAL